MRSLAIIFLVVLLSACAATGKPFIRADNPSEQEARLYVYRPTHFIQGAIYPTVYLDSKAVGELKNGGYLTLVVTPGEHLVTLAGGFLQWGHSSRTYHVSLEPGRTYYYKLDPNMRGEGNRTIMGYSFGRVEEENAAIAQLQSLNESR